ncbi:MULTISPECIES: DUF1294 domain-containing protein [unclassified Agarivorans]|uniref:DUF1294 domain-containing protein n=1 Tax=unclassified Agarivorans TaxID=2636026 RepID=UPI0026E1D1CB|nr:MULTISPECIES: DUF1294 domain-containing protein [unclassified Agarivorans]MDO6685570.1 DUF1294 domain-containing protein [Agarivorans sp. 3_MG-2023]MDO6715956.1 DUF1294 domain-containing protein [Agarivorans sp. 2_MG-2023]
MTKAKLVSWNDAKGFGFLKLSDKNAEKNLFVHASSFDDRSIIPERLIGHWFTYRLSADKQGRPCAKQLKLVGAKPAFVNKTNKAGLGASIKVAVFAGLLTALVMLANLPLAIALAYLVMSLVCFALYALDKSAAQAGRWRVQEAKLHVFALLGGWPGAMLAQQYLRHKTQKQQFRWVYYATVLLNCAALAYLLTPSAAPMRQTISEFVSSFV